MVRLPISGRLRAAAMNLFRLSDRNLTSPPERSSRMKVNPPEVPTPGMAGGEKPKATPSGSLLNSAFRRALMAWNCSAPGFPVAPFLHADKPERVVAGAHQAEQAETGDAGDVLDARDAGRDLLDLRDHLFGSLQGSRVGKLDVQVEVALVLVRNKTGGQFAADPQAGHGETGQKNNGERTLAQERPGDADIAIGRPAERAVEPAEEPRQQPLALASSASGGAPPARG